MEVIREELEQVVTRLRRQATHRNYQDRSWTFPPKI